jgi:hypothetical protein
MNEGEVDIEPMCVILGVTSDATYFGTILYLSISPSLMRFRRRHYSKASCRR